MKVRGETGSSRTLSYLFFYNIVL